MAKSLPRSASRRTGRMGSRKSARRIQNYSCSSKFQQHHCDSYRCTGSGYFLVFRRYLPIRAYKKRDTLCCSNRRRKYYLSSNESRYTTSRSQYKRSESGSRKRCSITSYSSKWYTF
uniref:Ribosomal protein S11 n=2 Tax=Aesculus TaxID=43363 RepID=A0A6M4B8N9_9ROSI|nr:30S ribosomal protein S11 [Aesculus assamica]QJQ37670.1 ribosomal protein S11 [Aesculus chinensis]QRF99844.1 30S ribosomal protein S11 [Aesculus assamica]